MASGLAPRPLFRRSAAFAVLAALAVAALAFAPSAQGAITHTGHEPGSTRTAANGMWVHWTRVQGDRDEYFLCWDALKGNDTIQPHDPSGLPGSSPNCSANLYSQGQAGNLRLEVPAGAEEGARYGFCVVEYVPSGSGYAPASSGCLGSVLLDQTKPNVSLRLNTVDGYVGLDTMASADYSDSLSPPYFDQFAVPGDFLAGSWSCFSRSGSCSPQINERGNPACGQDYPFQTPPTNASFKCIAPFGPFEPDGPMHFCVVIADGAVADNPSSVSQRMSGATANLSDPACASFTLDRTGPDVSAEAGATAVNVGDTVTFSATATDAGVGASGVITWFDNGVRIGEGASLAHTFTKAGTHRVVAAAQDRLGNGKPSRMIEVTVAGPPPPPSTAGPEAPGAAKAASGGKVTKAPSDKEISRLSGGGGVQDVAVAGLDLTGPKKLTNAKVLPMALDPETPGKLGLALLKGKKALAKGGATVTDAGPLGFQMKLPKGLAPGGYKVSVLWDPDGPAKARTKTFPIKVAAPKKPK